jgi:RNA polymerase-binding transcription factor DksA
MATARKKTAPKPKVKAKGKPAPAKAKAKPAAKPAAKKPPVKAKPAPKPVAKVVGKPAVAGKMAAKGNGKAAPKVVGKPAVPNKPEPPAKPRIPKLVPATAEAKAAAALAARAGKSGAKGRSGNRPEPEVRPLGVLPASAQAKPRAPLPARPAAPNRPPVPPRGNAKTAPVRKGDDRLTPDDLKHFEQRLLEARARVMREMGHLDNTVLKVNPRDAAGELSGYSYHMADAGTDSMEREKAFDIASKEGRLLMEIDDALRRLYNGTYGICEISGKPIGRARLEALPWARLSLEEQEKLEKEQRAGRQAPEKE